MIQPKTRIDRVSVERATSMANMRIESLRKKLAEYDAHKQGVNGMCKVCSFISTDRIGGTAITQKPCGICGEIMVSGNTCTNTLCKLCADANMLCRHCGGDIELKSRRKPRPYEQEQSK